MAVAPQIHDNVRVAIGLEPLNKPSGISDQEVEDLSNETDNGNGENISLSSNEDSNVSVKFENNEVLFERSLNLSYM